MRRYELMLLLRPDLEDDKLQAAVEKVTRAIVNAGGSLSKVSPWGKRRLAYDIQKHREASYFLIHFDIEPSAVREIERGMLISEEILRHLVTVLEDRGPAEELAPAAAARDLESATGDSSPEPAASATEDAGITAERPSEEAPVATEPAEAPEAPEAPETPDAPEAVEVPEAPEETSADEADTKPADEVRAEA